MGVAKERKSGVIHRRVRLTTTGAAGSAVATLGLNVPFGRGQGGILRALKLDFHASAPATTDVVIKADNSSGATLFTSTNSATDSAIVPIGMPGMDEAFSVGAPAAIAATDGTAGGAPFKRSLWFDVAQSDALTDAVVIDLWIEAVDLLTVVLHPAGADGSAVVTRQVDLGRAGAVRAMGIDFGAGVAATTDIVIKADSSSGEQLFTSATGTATDVSARPVGYPAVDEGRAATAATDATDGGWFFRSGLYFDVAQADNYVTNEEITIDLWID